eukprot:68878-Pleurochrysis_carterae.AAC.1
MTVCRLNANAEFAARDKAELGEALVATLFDAYEAQARVHATPPVAARQGCAWPPSGPHPPLHVAVVSTASIVSMGCRSQMRTLVDAEAAIEATSNVLQQIPT